MRSSASRKDHLGAQAKAGQIDRTFALPHPDVSEQDGQVAEFDVQVSSAGGWGKLEDTSASLAADSRK